VFDTARSSETRRDLFNEVVVPLERRLSRGLIAHFGVEIGTDVTSHALAWAWEHLEQVAAADNPAGLLFRVGQSAARRHRRWERGRVSFPAEPAWAATYAPELDDEVVQALRKLNPPRRTAVLMVHGYGFTYREVASMLGITETAVTNHLHRGVSQLRRILEVGP
jgi:RNA polymerase sigma-70 factor (ECF subfamily)